MVTRTMYSASTPLKISQPFQNVRLLELPDDLLNIITSSEQSGQPLVLKSSPSVRDSASQGSLHLCSNNKAWLVKQVSTSNSVYLTKSTEFNADGITAFARPSSILELHPVKPVDYESTVSEILRRLVPTITHAAQNVAKSQYSKGQLYNEIPAPRDSITRVLGQSCVFEVPWSTRNALSITGDPADAQGGRVFVPSPSLLLEVWRNILEAAVISETKITGNLEADMLLEAFAETEDTASQSHSILKAVARAMFTRWGYFETLGIITRSSRLDATNELNEMDLARWVGNMILRVAETESTPSIGKEQFETQWENAVPAYLAKYCSVEILGHSCNLQNDGQRQTVQWREFRIASKDVADIGSTTKATVSTSKGKRKWHDKFAATRTTKR